MAVLHTLLLTDIVDSTRITAELGDESMAALWKAHDRIARDLLPPWRGREIDKTDGMLLLFEAVADAVGYALAYHAAVAAWGLPVQARAGLHVGPVSLRTNSAEDIARGAKPVEVAGIALPTAARVMSMALGGQTLLSADARLALGVAMQRVRYHGHWRFKGIAEPVEIFEIGADGAPFRAPDDSAKAYRVVRRGDLWQPAREIRHSVPAERDAFVGREEPLHAMARKFEAGTRLVCLLGMGGTGKTRLATRFAWTVLGEYTGGVWFCDLSQARSLDGIYHAVAQGLDVPLGSTEPRAQLTQAIAGHGECLVILDNFEQVARHAEETLGHWLDRSPRAQFLVTTREVLGIVGEEIHALAPLAGAEASKLFLRRAEAVRNGYVPGPDDLAAIDQLVKVLDGLPLAIELAAARVRVMPPRALLARMHDRFGVLFSRAGRRDRQATLRAAFDWSWELLSEPEKGTLARLSVFEGGFSVDSAAAVVTPESTEEPPHAVDLVQWLVDKSFVRQLGDERFDLLESVRDYAGQHLRTAGRFEGSGPACEAAARACHWQYFARLDEREAVAGRCVELNNLVAGCHAATAAGDTAAATRCLVGAWSALRQTGPYRVAVELARVVAATGSLADAEVAWVHWVTGSGLDLLGDVEAARGHFDQGLAAAERAGATECASRLLLALGSLQTLAGNLDAALGNLTRAHRLASRLEHASLQATALNALGRWMDHQARDTEAREHYLQALALARALGDRHMEGGLLGNLGGLHHDRGELEAARSHYEQALALASAVGDRRWAGNAHCNLGLLYQAQGRPAEARTQFEVALETARDVGHVRLEYTVLCNLGILLTAEDQLAEGADHLERAVAAAAAAADKRAEGQFRGALALAQARLGRLNEARTTLRSGESLLRAMSDRLSQALLLCDRAEVESLGGDPVAARQALDGARLLAVDLHCGRDSELGRRVTALETAATVS